LTLLGFLVSKFFLELGLILSVLLLSGLLLQVIRLLPFFSHSIIFSVYFFILIIFV